MRWPDEFVRHKALDLIGDLAAVGRPLCAHVIIDYLQNPDVYELGDRVAVIGSGNSAMNAARTALHKGSRAVTVYARGSTVSASPRELDYLLADGAELLYGMGIQKITADGPVFIQRTFNEEGTVISESEPMLFPADNTIIAISQQPKDKLINTTAGLVSNEKGLLETDASGQTTRAGIFACGDVVTGPLNVVETVKNAKKVADNMTAHLERMAREE